MPPSRTSAGREAVDLAAHAGLVLDDWEAWVLEQALGEDDQRTYVDPLADAAAQAGAEAAQRLANSQIAAILDGPTRAGRLTLTAREEAALAAAMDERDAAAPPGVIKPMWSAFEVALIVSRQNGKGSILEARELAGLFLFGERLIIHTAHEFKTCSEAFRRLLMLIENCPDLDRRVARVRTSHGEEGIELANGQRIRFLARSQSSGRGFTADLIVYDEAMILDASKVGATLPTLSARPNPQVWYTASAGLRTSTQLAKVRRRGIAGTSGGLAFMEWSADVHDDYCKADCDSHLDPRDVVALQQSNPALGIRISVDHCEREREGMDEVEFARERLGVGQYPAPADAWAVIPKKWWLATMDKATDVVPAAPCFAVAVAPDRVAAAIGVAGKRLDRLTQVEVVEHRPGVKWVVPRCVAIDRKHRPVGWVVDPHADEGALIEAMEKAGLKVITMTATDVAHSFGQIYDAFKDGTLRHPDQSEMVTGLAGSEKRKLGEGQAWDRLGVQVDLSPVVAVTFAHWGYQKYGADVDYPVEDSVDFGLLQVIRMCEAGYYGPDDLHRLALAGALDAGKLPDALAEFERGGGTIPAVLAAFAAVTT